MSRSPSELVEELRADAFADGVIEAALVVRCEDSSEKVAASDPDALESLRGHIERGGQPIGTLLVVRRGQGSAIRVKALAELEEEEWAEKYLATVAAELVREAPEGE